MKKKISKRKNLVKRKFSIKKLMVVSVSILCFIIIFFTLNYSKKQIPCGNSISCINDLSGVFEPSTTTATFLGQNLKMPQETKTDYLIPTVLGTTTDKKRIEINLSNQRLYAYESNKIVYDFPVSTGKWYPTPTGTFYIWIKLRYTRMTGGSREYGTYYNLPNVPYTMYFYNDEIPKHRGFGIHGAYWHNNFGQPMSHGCVNMKEQDVAKLYNWADPPSKGNTTYVDKDNLGTMVVIYGKTPKPTS